MRSAHVTYLLLLLLVLTEHARADCENIDCDSIDGFHFGNGAGSIVDYGEYLQYYNATMGEWVVRTYLGADILEVRSWNEIEIVMTPLISNREITIPAQCRACTYSIASTVCKPNQK